MPFTVKDFEREFMKASDIFKKTIKTYPDMPDRVLLVSSKMLKKYKRETGIKCPRKFKGVTIIEVKF